jgi:hypothetical protein
MASIQDLWSGKTSPAHSHPTKVKTLKQSLKPSVKSKQKMLMFLELKNGKWDNAGLHHGRGFLPRLASCLDAQYWGVPQTQKTHLPCRRSCWRDVPGKYYLSPKACQGILRRASARGKELPEAAEEWRWSVQAQCA